MNLTFYDDVRLKLEKKIIHLNQVYVQKRV